MTRERLDDTRCLGAPRGIVGLSVTSGMLSEASYTQQFLDDAKRENNAIDVVEEADAPTPPWLSQ